MGCDTRPFNTLAICHEGVGFGNRKIIGPGHIQDLRVGIVLDFRFAACRAVTDDRPALLDLDDSRKESRRRGRTVIDRDDKLS